MEAGEFTDNFLEPVDSVLMAQGVLGNPQRTFHDMLYVGCGAFWQEALEFFQCNVLEFFRASLTEVRVFCSSENTAKQDMPLGR